MKIFLSVLLLMIALLSLYAQIDESAMEIYKETFNRAVYSFALVKGLNALISVIQSTEINVSLFIGATVGVGQVLDPINDLVERFSVVMLISSVSIGIQNLLLLFGKSMFIKITLIIFSFLVLVSLWFEKLRTTQMFFFSVKFVMLLFILRFGAVIFIYTTQYVYQDVYLEEYNSSNKYIQVYKNDLELIKDNKENMDSLVVQLKNKTEEFSKKVINLITIFVVTTILFPLLFAWFFLFLIKLIFNMKFDSERIREVLKC